EMTAICDRVLRQQGPAIMFAQPTGHTIPVLGNLFGTPLRVAQAMGAASVAALREVGSALAMLASPEPPQGFKDANRLLPMVRAVFDMAPKVVRSAACQDIVWEGQDVDLGRLPIQTC